MSVKKRTSGFGLGQLKWSNKGVWYFGVLFFLWEKVMRRENVRSDTEISFGQVEF